MKAELVAASEVAHVLIGLRQTLKEVGMAPVVLMLMHVDNQAAICQIEGKDSRSRPSTSIRGDDSGPHDKFTRRNQADDVAHRGFSKERDADEELEIENGQDGCVMVPYMVEARVRSLRWRWREKRREAQSRRSVVS